MRGLRLRLGDDLAAIELCINEFDPARTDTRPLVVWIHLDTNQGRIFWLFDREKVRRVDWFVFVSHWQMARFLATFGLPVDRCVVLRNATEVPRTNRVWAPAKPLRIAYTTVPYRGLSVLLDAWELLDPGSAELHIWSSNKLYGPGWSDAEHVSTFERSSALSGVHYHGIVPNAELRASLRDMDFLGYPSTVEETSCIAVMEAMAAGCRVVCPAFGALPETSAGFARLYPYEADPATHARVFADILASEIENPWEGRADRACEQQDAARRLYDWPERAVEWKAFLQRVGR